MCCTWAENLNLLKLQKLLYYVQAWRLAFAEESLFDGKFEAWVHGPVNREIFTRFAGQKTLYSSVYQSDMRSGFNPETSLSADQRLHIDNVLEAYAKFSGSELEAQAHIEDPRGFEAEAIAAQRQDVIPSWTSNLWANITERGSLNDGSFHSWPNSNQS